MSTYLLIETETASRRLNSLWLMMNKTFRTSHRHLPRSASFHQNLSGTPQGGWDYQYDSAGNISSVQKAGPPGDPASLTHRTHNALNQITSLGGGGVSTIRGTLSEPGSASVGITGQGDKPARMLAGNRFETEIPLQPGANSLAITALDDTGNRSDYVFAVNVAPQSPRSFQYDADGNLLADGVRTYEWDVQSRLMNVSWGQGSNKSTAFRYNALGQRSERIEKTGSTETAHYYYLYDGIHLLSRYTGGTAVANIDRQYLQQGEQRKNGGTWENYHYCRDHLGSVREVVKSDGTLQARYDYDPYGKRIPQYEAAGYTGGCDLGFTGHITQPSPVPGQGELVMTFFRGYDPELGRWLSADPIGERGGLNLYAYVGGGPVNKWDPLGLLVSGEFDMKNRTLTLRDLDTGETVLVHAFTGEECNPKTGKMTENGGGDSSNNKGPMPKGRWFIVDLPPDKAVTGWYGLFADDGVFNDTTNWRQRSGFRLHLGNRSEGCLTVSHHHNADKWPLIEKLLKNTRTQLGGRRNEGEANRIIYGDIIVK